MSPKKRPCILTSQKPTWRPVLRQNHLRPLALGGLTDCDSSEMPIPSKIARPVRHHPNRMARCRASCADCGVCGVCEPKRVCTGGFGIHLVRLRAAKPGAEPTHQHDQAMSIKFDVGDRSHASSRPAISFGERFRPHSQTTATRHPSSSSAAVAAASRATFPANF